MTPKDAHQLLVNATALLQLNRADHQKIVEALQVVEGLIEKPNKK